MHRAAHSILGPTALLLAVAAVGCERGEQPATEAAPPPEPELLHFPARLQAQDETVNTFIRDVIHTCASGDYDAFRMLWSVRDDPFPRDQFHRAWQSVQKVTIEAVRALRNPRDGSLIYAVRARVELGPDLREPLRDVVILLTGENNQWRLTMPPEGLSDDLFEDHSPTSQPDAQASPAGAP